MKQSEIKEGKMYSDGKTARVVLTHTPWDWNHINYVSSVDNFAEGADITLKSFARWAKYPCTVSVEVDA